MSAALAAATSESTAIAPHSPASTATNDVISLSFPFWAARHLAAAEKTFGGILVFHAAC
jgi:hypothetical protein